MASEQTLPTIHVQPGEWRMLREPGMLCTLLGSCVGVTFWSRRLGTGALCHPMLPIRPPDNGRATGTSLAHRYVDFTIRNLAARFDSLGAHRAEVEVKLFGGADVLSVRHSVAYRSVGALNGESAMRVLHEEGLDVRATCLGGTTGVQIHFNTANGDVLVRRLMRASVDDSLRPETSRDRR